MNTNTKNQIVLKKKSLPKKSHQTINIDLRKILSMLGTYLLDKIKGAWAYIWLNVKRKTSGWRLPWVRLVVLGVLAYVLLTRDMNFNFSMNAPIKAVQTNYKSHRPAPVATQSPVVVADKKVETVSKKSLQNPKHLAYIQRFEQVAAAEMTKYGIPASIQMAQALVESGAGKSKLATKNNNHFGIKCFSKKCTKGHCANFSDDHHKDFFRKYNTAWDSWRDHSKFIVEGKYKDLLAHRDDYKAWARGLSKHGYATDPAYADKLIATIELYDLHKLDAK